MMRNERQTYLDIIRITAAMMVIAMHAPIPNDNAVGIFNATLSYLTTPCIGLFFMISGALLLPIKIDYKNFIRKRFSKILWPTVFWSIFYILCDIVCNRHPINILKAVCSIPFSAQGHGVLWFMYTLAGLYLLAPILSSWLLKASRREIEFYLILWAISTCYPILENLLTINTGPTGILYYISGYVGYFLLGYYMKTYPDAFRFRLIIPLCVVSIVAPVTCRLLQLNIDFYSTFWYLSVFVVIMCIVWFKGIYKCSESVGGGKFSLQSKETIQYISNLAFGIYFVHIFVMRYILWKCGFIMAIDSYILQTAVVIALTAIISAAICMIISRTYMAEYIIGYKYKKDA